jgi:BirA family biotin operon repressor/biotin-[acetyl-CoA-carboxylase] ligase
VGGGGRADGALTLAEEQTAGRGRRGRQWLCAPRKGLMMISCCGRHAPGRGAEGDVAAAAAVADAVVGVCPALDPAIKWPNDILLGGRKVCVFSPR